MHIFNNYLSKYERKLTYFFASERLLGNIFITIFIKYSLNSMSLLIFFLISSVYPCCEGEETDCVLILKRQNRLVKHIRLIYK